MTKFICVTGGVVSSMGKGIAAASIGAIPAGLPVNHSPHYPPVIQPTLDTGTAALVAAALRWLAR